MSETMAAPSGLNHLVLNVRDMEESHRFWTEMVGLKQVGQLKASGNNPNPPSMRFYSCDHDGHYSHHDLALMENPALQAGSGGLNHVAIAYPTQEAWRQRLEHLKAQGVAVDRWIERGSTHSLYIRDPNGYGVELLYELPRSVWEGDIDAALNRARSVSL